MTPQKEIKLLFKILMGAAWIDGIIQPEERQYLHRVAKEQGIADDREIRPLLNELVQVKPGECYEWICQYLGDRPTAEACQQLIEATSALIYSDGEMAIEEAKLLNRIQLLAPGNETPEPAHEAVLRAVRNLYQRWIMQQR